MTTSVLIFLVEDEELIRQLLEEALTEGGFAVVQRRARAAVDFDSFPPRAAIILRLLMNVTILNWHAISTAN